MFRYILGVALTITVSLVLAQASRSSHSGAEPHACGQVNTPEQIAFLKANNPNLNLSFRPSMDTIKVPILFHRMADENGNGAITEADCANALIELNALYAPGRIVFEECESPRLISDSAFYDFQISEEFALRQAHEVSGVINVFVPDRVSTSSGGQVCGYAYLPPTRRDITMVKASCFTNGTTFPHEVGHFLGLYHTHGTSNCGELTDELVDGSNCDTRGDDVCDTPADPNLLGIDCDRYVVNSSCEYTGTETDANGDAFNPDTRNIMSYSRKACREGFSIGQLDRVRFYLGTSRSYLMCPIDICETTSPVPEITNSNMTTLNVSVSDVGPIATEVEFGKVGDRTYSHIQDLPNFYITGYSPCDSIRVRARYICDNGEGPWSDYVSVKLEGCGLQYCPQPNYDFELSFSDLEIANRQFQNLSNDDNYGIHPDVIAVTLDPTNARMELGLNPQPNPTGGPDSMYLQIWLDQNIDNDFGSNEQLLQLKVSATTFFNADIPINTSIPRDQQMRMRITTSVDSFVDPCETEHGETEDVNIIFSDDNRTVQWANGTLELQAPAQTTTVPLTADLDWTLSGLPAWLTTNASAGTANDDEISFSVDRNTACEARSATLVLTSSRGTVDELVVTQLPATPGITVSTMDTVVVGPLEGVVEFSSNSLHDYSGESAAPWLPFSTGNILDVVEHRLAYSINAEQEDRIGHINFEGCGASTGFVLKQAVGRTSWLDDADVQLVQVGDTIKLDVVSNVDWDALSDATWLSAAGIAGSGDGRVMYVYEGGAMSGETTEITLNGYFGLTEGKRVITVTAPILSSTSSPRLSAKLILPNPIADRLVATTASAKTYHWSIHSSLGQQLHESFGESLNLDTANWPAGTYFVKLEDEAGRILVERVIKF